MSLPMLSGTVGGTVCDSGINEVGDRTEHEEYTTSEANELTCYLYTADCSGTFGLAYFSHQGTAGVWVKVCVYSDDGDSIPDAGDSLVGCSTGDAVSTDGWQTLTGAIGGSSILNSPYWVCHVGNAQIAYHRTSTGVRTLYGLVNSGWYATPPSTLVGSWSTTASRDRSTYVVIGP